MPDGGNINTSVGSCAIPLLDSDIQMYDITPDNELRDDEFTQESLDCLAQRYINTRDRDVRSAFRNAMASALKDEVRQRIKALTGEPNLNDTIRDRIEYILRHEFPNQTLTYGVETDMAFDGERERNVSEGSDYSSETSAYSVNCDGTLNLRFPIANGTFQDVALIRGRINQDSRVDSISSQIYTYPSHRIQNNFEFYSQDGNYSTTLNIDWDHYYNPPPDHLIDQKGFTGSLDFQNLFDENLSLSLYVDNLREENTAPPAESGTLTNSDNYTEFDTELTYHLEDFGFVSDYSYYIDEHTSDFEISDTTSHKLSLLGQYTADDGYIRLGLGFGQSDNEESYRDGSQETRHDYGVYLRTNGKWQLFDNLGLLGSAEVYANRTEGTFVGWYPSWNTSLTVELTIGELSLDISSSYSGWTISLNEDQDKYSISGNFSIDYRPWEWAKINAYISINNKEVAGLNASDSESIEGDWSLSINPADNFWVSLYAGVYSELYQDNISTYNDDAWWAGFSISNGN